MLGLDADFAPVGGLIGGTVCPLCGTGVADRSQADAAGIKSEG